MLFVIVSTALFFALLTFCALRVRINAPPHRAISRCAFAVCALWLCRLTLGAGVGVNALTILTAGALGVPGVALLQVIARMR